MGKTIGRSILEIFPMLSKRQLKSIGDETERTFKGVSDRTGKYLSTALKVAATGAVLAIGKQLYSTVKESVKEAMSNTQTLIDKTLTTYEKRVDRIKIGKEMGMSELEVASLNALSLGQNVKFKSIEKLAQGAMKGTNEVKNITLGDGGGGTNTYSVKDMLDQAQGNNFMEKLLSLKFKMKPEHFNVFLSSIVGDRDALDINALLGQFSSIADYRKALAGEGQSLMDNGYVPMTNTTSENVGAINKASFYLTEGSESLNLSQLDAEKDNFIKYLELMSDAGDNLDKFTTAMIEATIALEEIAERKREGSRRLTLAGVEAVETSKAMDIRGTSNFIGQNADPFGYRLKNNVKTVNDPTIEQSDVSIGSITISTGGNQ